MSGEPLGSTLGVLDAFTREALVHTFAIKRSSDFVALLERIDRAYGPQPGQNRKPAVLVLDNGPIQAKSGGFARTSKASQAALAARSAWLAVECPGMPRN